MTFEEFKMDFERFSKIDTPQKLAICKERYRTHLLREEDNKFFEPLDGPMANFGSFPEYNTNLHSILGFNEINTAQILFLIQQSFQPESLLTMEKVDDYYELTYVELEESYWLRYYRDNSTSTARTKVFTGTLKKMIGDKVFDLIEQTMIEARPPQSGMFVLDGIKHKLSMLINGKRRDVIKHSPDEDSRAGRIIRLLKMIVGITTDPLFKSQNEIDSLITLIRNG
jgi:hypothetical protein